MAEPGQVRYLLLLNELSSIVAYCLQSADIETITFFIILILFNVGLQVSA